MLSLIILVCQIGLHIGRGLQYLNNQGMFHRDLTSKNVFIRKDALYPGRPGAPTKLTAIVGDFGLAARIPARAAGRLPQVMAGLLDCTS